MSDSRTYYARKPIKDLSEADGSVDREWGWGDDDEIASDCAKDYFDETGNIPDVIFLYTSEMQSRGKYDVTISQEVVFDVHECDD